MKKTLGSYLIELLEAQGVQHVFGIPGVHNLELYRGLASSRIRHITGRHQILVFNVGLTLRHQSTLSRRCKRELDGLSMLARLMCAGIAPG